MDKDEVIRQLVKELQQHHDNEVLVNDLGKEDKHYVGSPLYHRTKTILATAKESI